MTLLDQVFANALELSKFDCPPVVPARAFYDLIFEVKNNRAIPYRYVIEIEAPLPDGTIFRTESGGRMPMTFQRGAVAEVKVPVQAPDVAVPFMDNYIAKLYLVLGIKRILMNQLTCSTEKFPMAPMDNGDDGGTGGFDGGNGGTTSDDNGVTGTDVPDVVDVEPADGTQMPGGFKIGG